MHENIYNMNYKDFYTSHIGFTPYSYQYKVAELLLSGKNVILSVPTGAGKTWASIMPFLYAKEKRINFPSKLIYSLPLRTLTNSIYEDVKSVINDNSISIQTGEFSNDPYFESDIVFSTIDQTLSSFLCFPLSLSHGQANINAGALVGSYLVFDEFHLLDKNRSMATTIGMLRILRNMCRYCIMTATLTKEYMNFLKSKLGNLEIVSLDDFEEDKKFIKSLIPAIGSRYKKKLFVQDGNLNSEFILSHHSNKSIVICNRVETCQNIFKKLVDSKRKREGMKVFCIHSRFFDSDRKKAEKRIKDYFGKDSKEKDVILVSTQVIEAGMDITCDCMFTEISPINSFLQRAGRCARYAFESGSIYVFDVVKEIDEVALEGLESDDEKEIKRINSPYRPYDKDLCVRTINCLRECQHIDEEISQRLVNDILYDTERNMAKGIISQLYNDEYIHKAWHDCDKRHYRKTIRDIQSIEIALVNLSDLKNAIIIPWNYETISVYKWSFIGWAKKVAASRSDDEWRFAKAKLSNNSQFDFEWTENESYRLCPISIDELKICDDVVFVDNHVFDYSKAGLIVCNNTNNRQSPIRTCLNDEKRDVSFKMDTYSQHCSASYNCYLQEFMPKMSFQFSQLDKLLGHNNWNKPIKTMFFLHDFGKLNLSWQEAALKHQRKKMNDSSFFDVLAHTDFNPQIDNIFWRPPHASIGALQTFEMLNDEYGESIACAFGCAVLKHHSVDNDKCCEYTIPNRYKDYIIELTKEICKNSKFIFSGSYEESLSDMIPESDKEWILYFLMVRILRICDQKATKDIKMYCKG